MPGIVQAAHRNSCASTHLRPSPRQAVWKVRAPCLVNDGMAAVNVCGSECESLAFLDRLGLPQSGQERCRQWQLSLGTIGLRCACLWLAPDRNACLADRDSALVEIDGFPTQTGDLASAETHEREMPRVGRPRHAPDPQAPRDARERDDEEPRHGHAVMLSG